jgi:hypothetical protein
LNFVEMICSLPASLRSMSVTRRFRLAVMFAILR